MSDTIPAKVAAYAGEFPFLTMMMVESNLTAADVLRSFELALEDAKLFPTQDGLDEFMSNTGAIGAALRDVRLAAEQTQGVNIQSDIAEALRG